MSDTKQVRFYLPDGLRQSAESGEHNFLNKIASVLGDAGFKAEYLDPDMADPKAPGYSLFHMEEPFAVRSVTIRRAYYYPFWQIERTNERWNWDVARASFEPDAVERKAADQFFGFWQKRLFKEPLKSLGQDGFVYVPLQGRLTQHRSFQTCSPVEMILKTLEQDKTRRVIAALHPKEIYSEEDFAVLERLEAAHERLELRMGEMETLLPRCDYVVTENSSVGFAGFFFGKPCVTFAKIDFHHITADVGRVGIEEAFDAVTRMAPDYAGYVWWFLQQMSINAGRPEAEESIRARLSALGWPV
ncbi:hypothetical protein [Shimia aestuarii]|uniref:Capsular polysaccharide biosynthesis protein n=1 Tax=Shimia aestuarii TaxID=254406 RepID=A0A1I4KGV6_9RHOB|nr:hypothetical protein [Shimia aestuarii]SFL77859.1 hypothetical protein SAMN04488042_1011471 [Shimia aestuarii]